MKKTWIPSTLTLVISLLVLASVLVPAGGDPEALARVGTRYKDGDPQGTEGYDGQFVLSIASNPAPQEAAPHLDVPAYRYQRILLPILAHLFSLGQERWVPWLIVALNLGAHLVGTWVLARYLKEHGVNPLYALYYGIWVGSLLAIRLDLPEPLAFALVILGFQALTSERDWIGWVLMGLALFAREVTGVFIAAQVLVYLYKKQWSRAAGLSTIGVVPFLVFQVWLKSVFGSYGVGSGGAMATSFEWIPFLGILRIASYSGLLFLIYLVIFGPFVIYPALVGVYMGFKSAIEGKINIGSAAYWIQGLTFLFLPFSTYREPGGLLRFANGLVLALLLYISHNRPPRLIRYLPLSFVLLLFLVEV